MLTIFLPNEQLNSIHDIRADHLQNKGIKGIITDLDNTLVPWNVRDANAKVIHWFRHLQKHDIKIIIISNNDEERVSIFSKPLDLPFIAHAKKPLKHSFKKAAKQLELQHHEIAVVGDQLLTDILGGNLGGFYTILVKPIVETDAKITRFNRKIERRILNYLRKKGKLKEEDL